MVKNHPDIHIELEGTPEEVRAALMKLRERLSEHQVETFNAGTLEVVLAEVLNNVVEHALANHSDGTITLCANYDVNKWCIRVRDNGTPMPDNQIPAGEQPDVDADLLDLPEGGFGWMMVRTLAHDIVYARTAHNWNELTFTIPDTPG
ncbi:Serine-protein kinase RsbW [Shimia sp. SK013]|uniref:ATP-binding protein n=1 Tax=Shimia sp. SK013 TaxID=1389006 RepID=UPI0006B60891|nr:ATP-binding protein [Shimia sp. SK013]KPA21166.1 Serine-protein kinase RsbW [Shimia sp. SK013]